MKRKYFIPIIAILLALGLGLGYSFLKLTDKYDHWGFMVGLFIGCCVPSFALCFIIGSRFKIRDLYFPFAFSVPLLAFALINHEILLLPIGGIVLLFGKLGNHLGYKRAIERVALQEKEESSNKQVEIVGDSETAPGTPP